MDLVTGLQQKDRAALEYLYTRYAGSLYGIIWRILRQDDVSEEVLQDAFLKIWQKVGSYDPQKGRLFTWMLNVTRNLAIDKARSQEINKESKTDSIENFVSKAESTGQIQLSIDVIGLPESLTQLPEEQRFVVEHLYLKGYTQSELAEEFDIPLGTIKTRLRLAMVQLRSIYGVR